MRALPSPVKSPVLSMLLAWPALVLLAVGEFLLAGLAATPGSIALADLLGRRPAITTLASGDWPNTLANLIVVFTESSALAPAGAAPAASGTGAGAASVTLAALGTLAAVSLALLLQWLLYAFASGAALGLMSGRQTALWPAGAAWFSPMLRLGLLLILAAVALGGIAAVALLSAPGSGLPSLEMKLVAWLLWMAIVGSLFELARATMVARGVPSARDGIRGALRLLVARPLPVLGTWLALGIGDLAVGALIAALTLASSAAIPWTAWAMTILTVIAGTGYKLFRLAAQFHLASAGAERAVAGP